MLTKKKGDRVPKENIRGRSPRDMTVEGWLKDRDLWIAYPMVTVQDNDFVVDEENSCLYVKKTAYASGQGRWIGGCVYLWRIHTGWLRGEYDENHKFKTADVKDNKHWQIVNMVYKLVKVDDTIPLEWWNTD